MIDLSLGLVIGVPLGLLYMNACEWAVHKHLLHGLGRRKGSIFAFHWHEHHRNARRHGMKDYAEARSLRESLGQMKEAAALVVMALAHLPLLKLAPSFVLAVWFSLWNYYRVHERSHRDPDWARENLPWHVDHHMGRDQDANWCVSWPWFDHIMGTRKSATSGRAFERRGGGALRPSFVP